LAYALEIQVPELAELADSLEPDSTVVRRVRRKKKPASRTRRFGRRTR
jgi:hypothetical protein